MKDPNEIEREAGLYFEELKDELPKLYRWQGANTTATRTALRLALDHSTKLRDTPEKEHFIRLGKELLKLRLQKGLLVAPNESSEATFLTQSVRPRF